MTMEFVPGGNAKDPMVDGAPVATEIAGGDHPEVEPVPEKPNPNQGFEPQPPHEDLGTVSN